MEVEVNYFNVVVLFLVINIVFIFKFDVVLVEELKVKFDKVLDVYENQLVMNWYLVGVEFLLVDLIYMFGMRYIMNEVGLGSMIMFRENVNWWWNEMLVRLVWKKFMEMVVY